MLRRHAAAEKKRDLCCVEVTSRLKSSTFAATSVVGVWTAAGTRVIAFVMSDPVMAVH